MGSTVMVPVPEWLRSAKVNLLIWIMIGQGLTVFAACASGSCSDIFSLAFSFISLSLMGGWMA